MEAYPREAESTDSLTVSRKEAQKYEAYELWGKNRDGLFTDLGKFIGDRPGVFESRVTLADRGAKVKSSVENLRNPVARVVGFYATTTLTGKAEDMLTTEEDEGADGPSGKAEALKEAVGKLWEWSTLDQEKQTAKRYLALYGQLFVKVVKPEVKDHAYLQFIRPAHVTDFEVDERGNVVYIRTDVPETKRDEAGFTRKLWITEVWRKGVEGEPGYALFAESERTTNASVPTEKQLAGRGTRLALGDGGDGGDAASGYPFDFVPFVRVNAADTGEKRPDPVYAHGLHLVAWICREATRLSDLMFRFNKAFKVIGGMGNDAQGRPMPPPRPGNVRDLGSFERDRQADHTVPFAGERASVLSREDEDISIEGIAVTGLPGTAQMWDATPNINYEAARNWIQDHIDELHEELPELLYYSVKDRGNQSGTALRTLVAGAVSRAEEMQGNLSTGLAKATRMALTVAQLAGLDGFDPGRIGTFEDGGFEFRLEPPAILPLTEEEDQRVEAGKLDNAAKKIALGVPRDVVLRELGYEDVAEEVEEPEPEEPEDEEEPLEE